MFALSRILNPRTFNSPLTLALRRASSRNVKPPSPRPVTPKSYARSPLPSVQSTVQFEEKKSISGLRSLISPLLNALKSTRQHVSSSQIWWFAKYGFIFATMALFCTHRIVSFREIAGPSMLPTLNTAGDTAVVCMLYPRLLPVQAGDLISFESPMRSGERAIKRIIGMPGDLVLRDTPPGASDYFWMEADPERFQEENQSEKRGWMIRVPEGHCWVVGDNLPWSRDSRHFGPLPLALVKGRVIARAYPLRQFTWFMRSEAIEDID